MGGTIRVTVRFGGSLGSAIGVTREVLDVEASATVADLVRMIGETHGLSVSDLEHALPHSRGRHVSKDALLEDHDEVSFLLPVAGG